MKIGGIAKHFVINQKDGLREYSADVKLISKVGSVPDFWKFEIMTGQNIGRIINGFVYEEDQEPEFQKPKLTVIEGGVAAREKEHNQFMKHYYARVFEMTDHLFTENK